jgi:hypothetical protein
VRDLQTIRALSLFSSPRDRAPFRRLSARALRQAKLGASSGLAHSTPRDLAGSRTEVRAMRPTDFCHPNQDDHPRRRSFPAPRTAFAIRDARDDPWSSRCMTEGWDVFTTSDPLRTLATNTRPRGYGLTTVIPEHGPVRPVVFDATSPLTPLSRIPLRFHAHAPSCVRATPAAAERSTWVGKRREPPRPPLPSVRENQTARDDPRCLPSTGTLRRIRWPLQPRSRDPRIRF